jgi:aldehyde dehydrogenase (NAD+)
MPMQTETTEASEIPNLVAKLRAAFESGAGGPSTSAGSACVNATVMHVAIPELPFAGVGASGMGAYHGKAGFDVFSHRKSVLVKPTRLDPKLAYPPYTKLKERIIRRFL